MASNTSQLEDYLNQRFVRGTNARLGNDPGFAQYVAKQTASRPINPNSIKDVKTLQSALRTKQINPQQFQSQFYKINNFKTPTTTSTSGFNTNNIKQFGLGSAITAAKQLTVDPIVTSAKDTKNQAVKQFQHFTGPTATGQQRQTILNNQAAAQAKVNPQFNTRTAGNESPVNRLKNSIVSAYQHGNPFSGVSDANKLIDKTQKDYGLTPNFVKTLRNSNTSLTKAISSSNSDSKSGVNIVGSSEAPGNSASVNRVQLNGKGGNVTSNLIHEGLHQAWLNNPNLHTKFIQDYNKNATPELRSYLISRLQSYQGVEKIPKDALMNLNKMPNNLQDEVHSMTAEYYLQVKNPSTNPGISQYYSKFLDLNKASAAQKSSTTANTSIKDAKAKGWTYGPSGKKNADGEPINTWRDPSGKPGVIPNSSGISTSGGFLKGIESLPGRIKNGPQNPSVPNMNNSAAGTIQIQKMIAQGATPQQVATFAKKDAQALDTQTKKGINAAVTLAPLGAGAIGTTSRVLTKAGVTAALGKDEGVNALVSAQRAARATQAAKAADIVGSTATKEAKTTHIPVVGPTQTAAARTSLGSTAMNNVGRSTVPVVDKSTPVAGKVVAPPKNYIAKSTQLSKQYEKEVAGLQNVPSPHAQQVLQSRIDAKYAKLQQDLDTTYGQTKVAFTGKPTGPRSAFTTELENNAKAGPYTPPDAVTGSPAGAGPKTTKIPVTNGETAPTAPQLGETVKAAPKVAPTSSTGIKASGPSMREASRAIEAGMKSEPEVTGFEGVSHKVEAQKAAKLVDENPDKAYKIATGAERGDNVSHDRAVYHAVTQKEIASAHKTGDWSRVQELVAAPGHKEVSEAGQTLGAEGYHMNPHDPVKLMQDLVKVRKVVGSKRGVSVAKEAGTIEKTVKETVGRVKTPDWDSFVESLRC